MADTYSTEAGVARPVRDWLRITAIGGLAAPVLYIGSTVLGGAIVPGYSHVRDSVSSLTSVGTPHRLWLALGFSAYNVAIGLTAAGLLRTTRRSRASTAAGCLLAAAAAAGILMLEPFTEDPVGTPLTPFGIGHIVLVAVSAFGIVIATFLYAWAWRNDPRWRALSRPSWIIGVVVLVTGGIGSAAITTPVFGLLERFTPLALLTWFAAVGVTALRALRRTDGR
jgi:hypothetical protein